MKNPSLRLWVALSAVFFLLFFNARWSYFDSSKMFWEVDDGCYLDRAAKAVGVFLGEGVCPKPSNYFAPGNSILFIPAAAAAQVSEGIFGGTYSEWIVAWASASSFLFWAIGFGLSWIFIANRIPNLRRAGRFALAFSLVSPVFYYAVHRQILPHAAEWMVAQGFVLALIAKDLKIAAALALGLSLIRYNDFPAVLMLAGALVDRRAVPRGRVVSSVLLVLTALVGGYIFWLFWIRGYGEVSVPALIAEISWASIGSFWFGLNWGIVWTSPWLVAAAVVGVSQIRQLSWAARGALAWFACEILIGIAWGGNGGMFGYRYLSGCFAGLLWVSVEVLNRNPRWTQKAIAFTIGAAVWNLLLIHFFEGMVATGVGLVQVVGADGVMRRLAHGDFLVHAWEHVGDLAFHRSVWIRQSPLWIWGLSLRGYCEQNILIDGPTLGLLTLLNGVALAGLGVWFVNRSKKSPSF